MKLCEEKCENDTDESQIRSVIDGEEGRCSRVLWYGKKYY